MIFGAIVLLDVLDSPTPPAEHVRHTSGRSATVAIRPPAIDSSDLYSLRARRRFASYLRLRLLELREANLERAAAVIERRLPLSSLLEDSEPRPSGPKRGIPQR